MFLASCKSNRSRQFRTEDFKFCDGERGAEKESFKDSETVWIYFKVKGFKKNENGDIWLQEDLKVRDSSGIVIIDKPNILDLKKEKSKTCNLINTNNYIELSPVVRPGKTTVQITLRDKIGGGSKTIEKTFTILDTVQKPPEVSEPAPIGEVAQEPPDEPIPTGEATQAPPDEPTSTDEATQEPPDEPTPTDEVTQAPPDKPIPAVEVTQAPPVVHKPTATGAGDMQRIKAVLKDDGSIKDVRIAGTWAMANWEQDPGGGYILLHKLDGKWRIMHGGGGEMGAESLFAFGVPPESWTKLNGRKFSPDAVKAALKSGPRWTGMTSKSKMTQDDLNGRGFWELTLMRNEIYAKYGMAFKDPELSAYFNSKKWYKVNPSFNGNMLTKTERSNASFIMGYQKRKKLLY